MEIIQDPRHLQRVCQAFRHYGYRIGFVPTMGALHEGHLSLIRRARGECDRVVVSIFVNPLQFGPEEDYHIYPRDLPRDQALCREAGVDVLFTPDVEALYPEGFSTFVEVQGLSERWCGARRPGHFRGVATVVLKLFHLVQPHRTYFGQKDYQQSVIIRKMVQDLNLDLEVVVCPTVREPDGLALSSRNAYLTPEERAVAPLLYQALQEAAHTFQKGQRRASTLLKTMKAVLAQSPKIRVDYVALVDPEHLQEVREARPGCVLLVAAWIGKARLIDNWILE